VTNLDALLDRHFPLLASLAVSGYAMMMYHALRGLAPLWEVVVVALLIPTPVALWALYLWYDVTVTGGRSA
jgi:hypothetical protein